MGLTFATVLKWLYRAAFLITGVALIPTAYIVFAYCTTSGGGFNKHPFLPESNLGIALAVILGWPIMAASAFVHIVCWMIFVIRMQPGQTKSGTGELSTSSKEGTNGSPLVDDSTRTAV